MHLRAVHVQNFRRLRDVLVDFQDDITILVGANNSGKTSIAQVLDLFLNQSREKFTFHDFNAFVWSDVEDFSNGIEGKSLPEISLEIWLSPSAANLHRAIDLLPGLSWKGSLIGLRIAFSPIDSASTVSRFQEARAKALAKLNGEGEGELNFDPSPRTLTEFLTDELQREYKFKYYVLDQSKYDNNFNLIEEYSPRELVAEKDSFGKSRSGKDILNSLIRVDLLNAQRHLSDNSTGNRSEELSKHLSRFYKRNLDQKEDHYGVIQALSESEKLMNEHLENVFKETLESLAKLSYPGLTNLNLKILSELNPAVLLSSHDGASVHYALDDKLTLPDKYNGLGFKNLIYMVVELLDLHSQWISTEENRPPLHLIFVEEPEAHLHAQLQQVFVNKILDILPIDQEQASHFSNQLVLSTHSSHILYERGFQAIRYFRRENVGVKQSTSVLNLSKFYTEAEPSIGNFLERYLKLTHCDLFFCDAAILVEGNVERLLMPLMIDSVSPKLRENHLTILEIGGAFGYRFRSLIEFLGITALIITDLDSVYGENPDEQMAVADDVEVPDDSEDVDEEEPGKPTIGSTCTVETEFSKTSNQTLIDWLPGKLLIKDLLSASEEDRTQTGDGVGVATVRVCFQTTVTAKKEEDEIPIAGRTLEEAFAYENLEWCQRLDNKDLKLRVKSSDNPSLGVTLERIHKRVHGKNFKKTDFALALLGKDPAEWVVPEYIKSGLGWLEGEMTSNDALLAYDQEGKPEEVTD